MQSVRPTPIRQVALGKRSSHRNRALEDLESTSGELLSAEEIDTYARAFEKSGFFGPVSWYRNIDRNKRLVPDLGTRPLSLPCLQITAE